VILDLDAILLQVLIMRDVCINSLPDNLLGFFAVFGLPLLVL
jgi:hypothetical protein